MPHNNNNGANTPRMRYVINPLLQPTAWSGDDWGFCIYPNKSWLNSVWLGTVWNLMCLPQRFYYCVIVAMLQLRPIQTLIGLFALILNTGGHLVFGFMGRLIMLPYSLKIISHALVLGPHRAQAAINEGMFPDGRPVAILKP